MVKPFLKWVGGKRQLLAELETYMPPTFERYFEPFMGGAALFFHRCPQHAFLSDVNQELVNCYQIVKSKPDALIAALQHHYYDSDHYYQVRNLDRDPKRYASLSDVARAARLIFLNRTGFNGMYRVNSKGQFNVPFGRYSNPVIANETLIRQASAALQNADIRCQPYTEIAQIASQGDFVYFDPPYMPLSKTAHFTRYAKDDFQLADQQELAETCRRLHDKNVRFLASNAYHDDIKELYQGFEIVEIKARRSINSKADGRQAISEALIYNKL